MTENINIFLCKSNIYFLYKKLTTLNELDNISKQKKSSIINILVDNMKKKYKTLDMAKINDKNINSVKNQFNTLCLKETEKNIQHIIKSPSNIFHDRKHKRDFNTFNRKVNFMERPIVNSNLSSASAIENNFHPATHSIKSFNDNKTIDQRLQELENSRRSSNPVPVVPDFIKSVSVGKKENFSNKQMLPNNTSEQNMGNNYGSFQPMSSSNDNFSTVNNITFDSSKYNENMSTGDRLKQIEKERQMSYQPIASNNQPPQNEQRQPMIPPNQPLPPQNNIKMQEMIMEIENLKHEINILKRNGIKSPNIQNHMVRRTNIRNLQLEINKNESFYDYQFTPVQNIIGIKLVSYSLPKPKYNIIDFKLKYNFDDNTINTEKEIVIPDGYYDINSLLDVLNNNEDIEFSVGNNQKIKMSIKIPKNDDPSAIIVNKNFKLLINKTSKQLGFINQNDEFLLNLQADKLWDLRLPTKVYMYILNLQKESPFGILNFNGTSTCELTFNNPISLSNLNILFVTENNKNYNFNDLNYNLSFQINVLENNPYFNFVSNIQ